MEPLLMETEYEKPLVLVVDDDPTNLRILVSKLNREYRLGVAKSGTKALEYMGAKEADVTIIKGLSDKQKKKLLLEDNKIQDMSFVNYGDVERMIKEIGDTDIIGYTPEYLDAIINEVSPDNMGVSFDQPAKREDTFSPENVRKYKGVIYRSTWQSKL